MNSPNYLWYLVRLIQSNISRVIVLTFELLLLIQTAMAFCSGLKAGKIWSLRNTVSKKVKISKQVQILAKLGWLAWTPCCPSKILSNAISLRSQLLQMSGLRAVFKS